MTKRKKWLEAEKSPNKKIFMWILFLGCNKTEMIANKQVEYIEIDFEKSVQNLGKIEPTCSESGIVGRTWLYCSPMFYQYLICITVERLESQMQSDDPFVESKTDHQENPEIHSKIESEIHSIDNEIPSQEIISTPIQKKRKLSAACIRLVFIYLSMPARATLMLVTGVGDKICYQHHCSSS